MFALLETDEEVQEALEVWFELGKKLVAPIRFLLSPRP